MKRAGNFLMYNLHDEADVCKKKGVSWASYRIRNIAGCTCAENARNVSPPSTSKETTS